MIAVITAMGGEIEGNRKAFLAGGKIAPVEGIRIFRARETGILPDRPRLCDIHGGVGATQIRRDAGKAVETDEPFEVAGGIGGFHRYALGRWPRRAVGGCRSRQICECYLRKIRNPGHAQR